jgi:hypothetical protein
LVVSRAGLSKSALSKSSEDLVVLAALAAARARRQRQLARRSVLVYEYQHFSWSIDLMPPGKAQRLFRFSVEEVYRLVPLLRLHEIPWRRRVAVSLGTALCIVLARLSFPGRWCLLSDIFGRSQSWLSTVSNDVIVFLAGRFGGLLRWHPQLTYSYMEAMLLPWRLWEGGREFGALWMAPFDGFAVHMAMRSSARFTLAITGRLSSPPMALFPPFVGPLQGLQTTGQCGRPQGVMRPSGG